MSVIKRLEAEHNARLIDADCAKDAQIRKGLHFSKPKVLPPMKPAVLHYRPEHFFALLKANKS